MPPHDLHSDPLAPAAAGDSERPLFLDVEVEGTCEEYSGRYVLTEELLFDAPVWQQLGGRRCLDFCLLASDPKVWRWMLSEPSEDGGWVCTFMAAEGCSASTPPQSVGAWVTWDKRAASVRISVADLESKPRKGKAEAAQLTAKLYEAQAHAERQRAAAQKAAEQLKAERAAAADLKKALGRERGAKETAEAALADSRREATQLTAERDAARAAADDAAEKLGGERAAKEAVQSALEGERAAKEAAQSALAAARREAAQVKAERDAERAAAGQAAEKQVPGIVKQLTDFGKLFTPTVSRYYELYAVATAAGSPTQIDAMIKAFLRSCAKIPGAGHESEFLAMHTMLARKVDARIAAHKAKGEGFGRMSEAEARMALAWSAGSDGCAKYNGRELEFCGWINLALVYTDCDRPLQRVLPVVRTLNRFCVTAPEEGDDDAAPEEGEEMRWAGEEMKETWDDIGRNDWKLFRGGGLCVEHKAWFVAQYGKPFRQPRYLATSLKQGTAERFARREGAKPGRIPVIWEVLIHKERRCCHVNCLGTRFSFYDEAELLFPPGSVFTVKSVDWAEPGAVRLSRITIEAAPDNKYKEYPLNLPEAPWA